MEIRVTLWCVCCNTQTCLLGTHGAGMEGPCENRKTWSFYVQDSKPHIRSDCKTALHQARAETCPASPGVAPNRTSASETENLTLLITRLYSRI